CYLCPMTSRSNISSFTISVALWFVILVDAAMGQSIFEGAKKEGQVVLYASMEAVSAQKIVAAFEKKYPFIKVDATRIGSERLATCPKTSGISSSPSGRASC